MVQWVVHSTWPVKFAPCPSQPGFAGWVTISVVWSTAINHPKSKQNHSFMGLTLSEMVGLWHRAAHTIMFVPAGGKPRQRFARFCKHALSARYVTAWVLGWVGWGGNVNVHVNLQHTRMLRHVLGWVGWGGRLTCMWTCDTHAHATSRLGLGGVGGGC